MNGIQDRPPGASHSRSHEITDRVHDLSYADKDEEKQ
jgi:hypothetical protein